MLLPAVTLDAAMTAREALARLARQGYWLDPASPAAREVLAEYVQRIGRQVQARGSRAMPPERSAERRTPWRDRPRVLRWKRVEPEASAGDAGTATAPAERPKPQALDESAAARLLARPLAAGRVAIRRQDGTTIFWYAMPVERVLGALTQVPSSVRLVDALPLHESTAARTQQAGLVSDRSDFEGVVLSGHDFVAVSEPERKIGFGMSPGRPRAPSPAPSMPTGGTSRGEAAAPPMTTGERGPSAGAEPPVAAAPSGESRETREVRGHPHVDAPDAVVVGTRFDVEIGLRDSPMAGVQSGGAMTLSVPTGASSIDVEVQVVAEGFEAPEGTTRMLSIRVDSPYDARVRIPLRARAQDEPVRLTTLLVQFAVGGVTYGSASRNVVVQAVAGAAPPADPRGIGWNAVQPVAPALTLATPPTTPDVELNIAKPDGNPAKGDYVCTMRNAHGVPVPSQPLAIHLGDDARTFAKAIIDDMRQWDGEDLLATLFQGHGATIAGKLPREFWDVLRAVAAKVPGRAPTLQLNSAEPYVPWELALVDPPLDPDRPPVLAAQVAMGRWILGDSAVAAPPRHAVPVKSMAVMAGMYNAAVTGLRKLPKAEAEVMELEQTFAATPRATRYDCDPGALKSLLDAAVGGGAQAVHFAGHGQVDPTRPGDAALFLSNGKPLSPVFFRKTKLGESQTPFIFLNACMVGTGGEMLGDFGGFPGNCLAGGFSGLVAPLWAVNDDIAKWIAIEFYDRTIGGATPVAEALRDLRANYADHPNASSYLAYVYYGNPYLSLA